jgi:hypothetical protein
MPKSNFHFFTLPQSFAWVRNGLAADREGFISGFAGFTTLGLGDGLLDLHDRDRLAGFRAIDDLGAGLGRRARLGQ